MRRVAATPPLSLGPLPARPKALDGARVGTAVARVSEDVDIRRAVRGVALPATTAGPCDRSALVTYSRHKRHVALGPTPDFTHGKPRGALGRDAGAVATYETITVDPLTVNIGAQVDGVDLRQPLSEQQRVEIHDALMRHLVLFFRDQDLSEDQQLAFATAFGPPVSASVDTRPDAKQVLFVNLEDNAESPPKADRWHTDVPFIPMPPDIAVLNMRATPPVGGDTLWLSLYAVHDALSPTMQELLSGLRLDMQLGASKETILELYGEEYYREVVEPFKGAEQPLVRVHPVTGRRALYLAGSFMRRIVGLSDDESAAILALLQSKLDDPNVQCRWRWRQFDVAVWDERCTNHRAMSDHYPHYRMIRRCLAGAGVPIAVGDPR